MHTGVWWGNLRERDDLEYSAIDDRIRSSGNGLVGIGWIDMARDTDSWRALVSAVTNLLVP